MSIINDISAASTSMPLDLAKRKGDRVMIYDEAHYEQLRQVCLSYRNDAERLQKENEQLRANQNKVSIEKLEEIKDRIESLDYKTTTKKEQYNKLIYTINGLLAELKGVKKWKSLNA